MLMYVYFVTNLLPDVLQTMSSNNTAFYHYLLHVHFIIHTHVLMIRIKSPPFLDLHSTRDQKSLSLISDIRRNLSNERR
jgi:hypothetical protein